MLKKIFVTAVFTALILFGSTAEKVSAQDVWLDDDFDGNGYWAIAETFDYIRGADYCDIDYKITFYTGDVKFFHCRMWSSGNYCIDNKYRGHINARGMGTNAFVKLYAYTKNRINSGEYTR